MNSGLSFICEHLRNLRLKILRSTLFPAPSIHEIRNIIPPVYTSNLTPNRRARLRVSVSPWLPIKSHPAIAFFSYPQNSVSAAEHPAAATLSALCISE
jgi:hypothetical protein